MIVKSIRNDSDLTVEEAVAFLEKEGVRISYGGMEMAVQRDALKSAREWVAGLDPETRRGVRVSVDNALRRALPKMLKGRFSKKTADNFHGDLLLWEALKGYAS